MSKTTFFFLFFSFFFTSIQAQKEDDAKFIRNVYTKSLTESQAYPWLEYLCTRIGGRLSGSPQAAAAVEYTRQMLDSLGVDSVWLQPVKVPHWIRGEKEIVRILNSSVGDMDLTNLALGNSLGTDVKGLSAEVIEVKSLDEVDKLGKKVAGKIVFFNRPMDATKTNTFHAYGGAVDQRGGGAIRAAKYGAVAVLVRSMTVNIDDVPHTGATHYEEGITKIPALAISTKAAETLSDLLQREPVRVYIRNTSRMLKDVPSYNVIGELRGTEKPSEIITVGGHLDSWDPAQGAHDDGTGCVQSMDVLNVFKRLGYRPKHTIRCVLFMNEENGLRGGTEYAKEAERKKEKHLAAIETDEGGFTPRSFSFEVEEKEFAKHKDKIQQFSSLLEPYELTLHRGGSGADIGPLEKQGVLLIGLNVDTQRYFDIHHTPTDNIENVSPRELQMGIAALTSLIYLLDKYEF